LFTIQFHLYRAETKFTAFISPVWLYRDAELIETLGEINA